MEGKICLDTDACIELIRQSTKIEDHFKKNRDILGFVSTITVFELNLRKTNLDKVKALLDRTFILPFDEKTAIEASRILKNLTKKGMMMEMRDLFIAATAISNNCDLLTFNKKHFQHVEELELVNI